MYKFLLNSSDPFKGAKLNLILLFSFLSFSDHIVKILRSYFHAPNICGASVFYVYVIHHLVQKYSLQMHPCLVNNRSMAVLLYQVLRYILSLIDTPVYLCRHVF